MNPYEIIDKYYPDNTEQRQILVIHSLSVAGKAMKIEAVVFTNARGLLGRTKGADGLIEKIKAGG